VKSSVCTIGDNWRNREEEPKGPCITVGAFLFLEVVTLSPAYISAKYDKILL